MLAAAVAVSLWLGRRATLPARIALWGSTLLVSAAMFLPSTRLSAWIGPGVLGALTTALQPWEIGDVSHFLAFTWLGLVLWLLRPDLRGWRGVAVLVALATVGELIQGAMTVERSARLGDVMFNLLGAVLGLALAGMMLGVARALRSRPRKTRE